MVIAAAISMSMSMKTKGEFGDGLVARGPVSGLSGPRAVRFCRRTERRRGWPGC